MIPGEHPDHGMIREVFIGRTKPLEGDGNPQWIVVFHDGAAYEMELGKRLPGSLGPTLEPPKNFKPRRKGGTGN